MGLLAGRRRCGRRWSGRAAARCRPGRRWRRRRGSCGRRRRRRCRRRRRPGRPGSAAHTSATQRSASGRIAGPLSPPGRPSGIAAGSALPTTTAAAPASRTRAGALHDADHVAAELGQHRHAAGQVAVRRRRRRSRRGTARGRRRRRWPAASGEERLTSIAETPGRAAQPPGQLGVLPQRAPAIETDHAGALLRQPRQLGGEEGLEAGVLQADRVDQAGRRLHDPRQRAAGRGLRVIERVTKPPRSARSPYAASSRPVPPQPEATSTGGRRRPCRPAPGGSVTAPRGRRQQLGPADPVAAEHRAVDAGARPCRATPSSPTTGTAQPWHRPVAQVSGRSSAVWLQAPWPSAAAATACRVAAGRRRTRPRRRSAASTSSRTSATAPRRPTEPSRGDHGDGAGRAAGLQRGEQVGLVGAGHHEGDRAAALAQPLGEREQRRRGVPLPDEQAADRLLGQREGPAERAGQLRPSRRAPGRPARRCRRRWARRRARWWRRTRRPA